MVQPKTLGHTHKQLVGIKIQREYARIYTLKDHYGDLFLLPFWLNLFDTFLASRYTCINARGPLGRGTMTMLESQYYNQALKFFVHEKRVPVKRILTEANISRSRFYAYLNGVGDLGMTRLLSILNVLHVNLTDFLMYARVLQEEACQTIGKKPTQQGLSRSEQLQIAAQVATQVHDYAPLVQVLRQIQQTVDYDEERAQIQPLLPLITGILCASTYRTATELALF